MKMIKSHFDDFIIALDVKASSDIDCMEKLKNDPPDDINFVAAYKRFEQDFLVRIETVECMLTLFSHAIYKEEENILRAKIKELVKREKAISALPFMVTVNH